MKTIAMMYAVVAMCLSGCGAPSKVARPNDEVTTSFTTEDHAALDSLSDAGPRPTGIDAGTNSP